jgi:anti-sigma factor RsiW
MNPCAKSRKRIALMASDVLDVQEREALREHIADCPACRAYWRSMSDLTGRLKNAGSLPAAEATESFHRGVARKIAAPRRHFAFYQWAIAVQRLLPGHRLAGFGVSVAVIVAVLLVFEPFRRRPNLPHVDRDGAASVASRVAPPSTLASYRRAAEISLESLDTFLTQQAARTSTATDTFQVSSTLQDSPDN